MYAVGFMVSEKKIFKFVFFFHYKSVGGNDLRGMAS